MIGNTTVNVVEDASHSAAHQMAQDLATTDLRTVDQKTADAISELRAMIVLLNAQVADINAHVADIESYLVAGGAL